MDTSDERALIQFHCEWRESAAFEDPIVGELLKLRESCRVCGGIGVTKDGIGYGNVSVRHPAGEGFIVSASQTGHLASLTSAHLCCVRSWSIERNAIRADGPMRPSSEALTHAAIYEAADSAGAVAHIHHAELWRALLNDGLIFRTSAKAEAGTCKIAEEVKGIVGRPGFFEKPVIVLPGHKDGIIIVCERADKCAEMLRAFLS